MKANLIYERWLRRRREVDVPQGFADDVMRQIHLVGPIEGRAVGRAERLLNWMQVHPAAQAAAVVLATALAVVQSALLLRIAVG